METSGGADPTVSVGLDDVLITEELHRRPAREPQLAVENRALHALAEQMADKPGAMLQALVRAGVDLCRAGTAGVSLLERAPGGEEVFRGVALAGRLEQHVGGTTPRSWSPCGTCLDRRSPQLYRHPGRYFTYLNQVPVPLVEGLVIPFYMAGEPLGTIWIVSHDEERQFDSEDVRVMTSLANFTAAAFSLTRASPPLRAEQGQGQLTALIENSQDFIGLAALDGRVVYLNTAGRALVGLDSLEAARLTTIYDYPSPEHVPSLRQVIPAALERHGRWEGETVFRHFKTGAPIAVEMHTFPVTDAAGQRVAIGNIGRDITDRKRVEEELRRREVVFRSLSACSPVGVFMADVDGRGTYTNSRCQAICGFTLEESLGEGWSKCLHPEDHERVVQGWRAATGEGEEYTDEFRIRRPDGIVRWVHGRAAPLRSAAGELLGYVGTVEDITDRSQTEALLAAERRILEMVALGEPLSIVLDALLMTFEEQCPGRAASILLLDRELAQLRPVAGPSLPQEWLQSITPLPVGPASGSCGTAVYRGEAVVVADIGADPLWAEYREGALRAGLRACWSTPILGSDRRILGTFALYHREPRLPTPDELRLIDGGVHITQIAIERHCSEAERSRLVAREQAARADAEAANRAKDEFLAVLSHELRTPLSAILGWARILKSGTRPPEVAARAIETIERNALIQAHLIDDLLDVSRIIAGTLAIDRVPVDLATVIQSAADSVRPSAEARQVAVDLALDPGAPRVRGDPAKLQQIVWNLLSNAVKFTPSGGRVEVRLERHDTEVGIVVRDTGRGISADFLPRLFRPFSQADTGTTRVHPGLGLGLAIVRHLVALHDGTVTATSPGEGQGAVFTVALPVDAAEARWGGPMPAPGSEPAESPLREVRVLLVEDDADSRDLVAMILTWSGAAVESVASAAEALEAVDSFRPHILISDVRMADIDGYALMRELRRRDCRVVAVALTACAGPEDRAQARAAGFQLHLAKPIHPDELVAVVSRLARTATC